MGLGGLGKQLRGGRSSSGNASALRTAQTDTPARPPRPLPSSSQGSRSCSGSAARALRVRQSERSNALALVPTQTDGTCSTDELHVRSCQRHVVPVEGKKKFSKCNCYLRFFLCNCNIFVLFFMFYFVHFRTLKVNNNVTILCTTGPLARILSTTGPLLA